MKTSIKKIGDWAFYAFGVWVGVFCVLPVVIMFTMLMISVLLELLKW